MIHTLTHSGSEVGVELEEQTLTKTWDPLLRSTETLSKMETETE
jgi:hypothetical protein